MKWPTLSMGDEHCFRGDDLLLTLFVQYPIFAWSIAHNTRTLSVMQDKRWLAGMESTTDTTTGVLTPRSQRTQRIIAFTGTGHGIAYAKWWGTVKRLTFRCSPIGTDTQIGIVLVLILVTSSITRHKYTEEKMLTLKHSNMKRSSPNNECIDANINTTHDIIPQPCIAQPSVGTSVVLSFIFSDKSW